jgi:ABC-type transport system involved in multi-copper enzyme maturation permease subunit
VIVLLGVIATAFFIPNMLRTGSVDLLLAKPISRPRLLLFKYLGGLTFLFLNAAAVILVVWLFVGLRLGIWSNGFLLSILMLTFFFAVLYSVSTLLAVGTRSIVVCILGTLAFWLLLFGVGFVHGKIHPAPLVAPPVDERLEAARDRRPVGESRGWQLPGWAVRTVDSLHAVLPRTSDLGDLTTQLMSEELLSEAERRAEGFTISPGTTWAESLSVTAGFIAVMLGLSCWIFARRDY